MKLKIAIKQHNIIHTTFESIYEYKHKEFILSL